MTTTPVPTLADIFRDDTVDRRAYLDPAVFERELDRIFTDGWVYVTHETQLAGPGDFVTTSIGRNPVIVVRDGDGQVRVLHNRCVHRGATVCQGDHGTASFFRCAYHGWTYKLDGSSAGITYQEGYASDDAEELRSGLVPVADVESYRGFVFARLRSGGPTLLEHLGAARPYMDLRLDAAPDGLALRSGRHKYTYGFNWKIQCENVVDGYHANFVHQGALSILGRRPDGKPSSLLKLAQGDSPSESADLGNGHALLDQRKGLGDRAVKGILRRPGGEAYHARLVERLGGDRAEEAIKAGSGEGMNLFVFPNLAFVSQQVRVIHPRAVDRTDVDLYPTWLDGAPDELNADRLRQHELQYGPAGFIGPDDLEIFRRVAEGLHAGDGVRVDLRRGRHRTQDREGVDELGHFTDESPQRAFWREWTRRMDGAGGR